MFKIRIINIKKKVYYGFAKNVVLPSTEGELTILPFHQPLICRLTKGIIKVDNSWSLMIKDGLANFSGTSLEVIIEL